MSRREDHAAGLEARLRDTLTTAADSVSTAPGAYRRVQSAWRRRERRRRLLVVALSTLIIGGADVVGLWALNDTPERESVVFHGPGPVGP